MPIIIKLFTALLTTFLAGNLSIPDLPLVNSQTSITDISSSQSLAATIPQRIPPIKQKKPEQAPLLAPILPFQENITLKSYGTYITPQNSPVSPERFQGFHTGADIEVTEQTLQTAQSLYPNLQQADDNPQIPVRAIADGKFLYRNYVNGYGGVAILQHEIQGKTYSVLYGHLRHNSIPTNITEVQKGDIIGILGKGYTPETDNERQHLHFAIKPGIDTDLKGYVQSETDLLKWENPVSFY